MASIPLSDLSRLTALAERRAELLEQLDRASRLVSVAAYFANDGTESEPLPERLVAPVRDLLTADLQQQLDALDAELRAAGIDPQA